jgi:hypothetical protein
VDPSLIYFTWTSRRMRKQITGTRKGLPARMAGRNGSHGKQSGKPRLGGVFFFLRSEKKVRV